MELQGSSTGVQDQVATQERTATAVHDGEEADAGYRAGLAGGHADRDISCRRWNGGRDREPASRHSIGSGVGRTLAVTVGERSASGNWLALAVDKGRDLPEVVCCAASAPLPPQVAACERRQPAQQTPQDLADR